MRLASIPLVLIALLLTVSAPAADTQEQKVNRLFVDYDNAHSPGCSLGVIRNGNFVLRKSYGMGSLELGVPLSSGSVFYMGSVSKQFTAASVVLAAEQGFLSLDDDVRKYIPELPDYGHPITLRQMLHHTSGFRDVLTLLALSGRHLEDIHPAAELLDLIARQKALNFVPGDEYQYSNSNYFLLAEVVKRATKKPLSQFAAESIFKPLGMTHTRFYDDRSVVVPGRVAAYRPGKGGAFLVDWSTNYETVGGGGLMSSVDDLLLWDRNFYDNKLGKGTLIKEMLTRGVLNNGKQTSYALGNETDTYRGLPVVGHGGQLMGYRTNVLRFPGQKFGVVCLCNVETADPYSLSLKVADIYLGKYLQPIAARRPKAVASRLDPAPLAGTYYDATRHERLAYSAENGNLIVQENILDPVGPNRFEGPPGFFSTFSGFGDGQTVTVTRDGATTFSGSRLKEFNPDSATLAAYTGVYTSSELDTTYKFTVEDGSLMLWNNWDPPLQLQPMIKDEFSVDGINLVFHKDSSGKVSGLSVYTWAARNVSFEKKN
jgi:CubicO group peptidase (beta-lactamase class C family)